MGHLTIKDFTEQICFNDASREAADHVKDLSLSKAEISEEMHVSIVFSRS